MAEIQELSLNYFNSLTANTAGHGPNREQSLCAVYFSPDNQNNNSFCNNVAMCQVIN